MWIRDQSQEPVTWSRTVRVQIRPDPGPLESRSDLIQDCLENQVFIQSSRGSTESLSWKHKQVKAAAD
ncbi:hypothetical protein INR49_008936 [Caranx melampygus]|nr:hypothetical protein INR49_008936 [Caranx melampygus]